MGKPGTRNGVSLWPEVSVGEPAEGSLSKLSGSNRLSNATNRCLSILRRRSDDCSELVCAFGYLVSRA